MAQEKITPLNGHVLVHYEAPAEKTASGLYVSKPKHEALPNKGKIYEVAPDITELAKGDYIVFKYDMNKGVHFEDLKLILVPVEDVLGVITDG